MQPISISYRNRIRHSAVLRKYYPVTTTKKTTKNSYNTISKEILQSRHTICTHYSQQQKYGRNIKLSRSATHLHCDPTPTCLYGGQRKIPTVCYGNYTPSHVQDFHSHFFASILLDFLAHFLCIPKKSVHFPAEPTFE